MPVIDHAPIFLIEWSGKRIAGSTKAMISSFEFDQREKSTDEVRFHLAFDEGVNVDTVLPKKRDPLRVQWGALGGLSEPLDMLVYSVSPVYGTERKFTIVARDRGHDLGRTAAGKNWQNVELRGIVTDVAKAAGLTPVLPSLAPSKTTGQNPQQATAQASSPSSPREAKLLAQVANYAGATHSPRQILQDIAARTGCEMRVRGKTLEFMPKGWKAPTRSNHVFRYRAADSPLLEFGIKPKDGGKHCAAARGVTAAGIDDSTGQPFSSTANDASMPGRPVAAKDAAFGGPNGDGKPDPSAGYAIISELNAGQVGTIAAGGSGLQGAVTPLVGGILAVPSGKPADADAHAKSAFSEGEGNAVTASFRILGAQGGTSYATLGLGSIIDVQNIDPEHRGKWRVTACNHKIDSGGYVISGQCKRQGGNAKGRPTKGSPNLAAPQKGEAHKPVVYAQVDNTSGATVGTETR